MWARRSSSRRSSRKPLAPPVDPSGRRGTTSRRNETNILLLASHAIAEYDDLRMLTDLGYDVFCPGGYADPANPGSDLRPALPIRYRADLDRLCNEQREKHPEGTAWAIDWAKADIAPDLLDWADTVIVHHFPERWIVPQWGRIRAKRVIWRTCGQSNPSLEAFMAPLHRQGLQIVRYSPKERTAFEKAGSFAGEDAMIRFGKYASDWYGWTGEDAVVGNVTQDMVGRAEHCGLAFWRQATHGLPVKPAGQGSELLGGVGTLTYDAMREYLRAIRVYLYTGTQPASYTLGLIEAMMTGVPVVSIGPERMWQPDLFEGHEISDLWNNNSEYVNHMLRDTLLPGGVAGIYGSQQRAHAISLFGMETVGRQWLDFLGSPTRVTVQREAVTA